MESSVKTFETDICFVCCSDVKCNPVAQQLEAELYSYTRKVICPKSKTKNFLQNLKTSACIVICVCSCPNNSFDDLVKKLNKVKIEKNRIIIVGKCDKKRNSLQFEHFSLTEDYESCIHSITHKIEQYNGVYTRAENVYEVLDSANTFDETISDVFSKRNERGEQETELKQQFTYATKETIEKKQKRSSVTKEDFMCNEISKCDVRDVFIHAQTLMPYETSHGPYALESVCKSRVKYELPLEHLKEHFNQSESREQIEIRKIILTTALPNLKSNSDFHGLCILLGCKDYYIQCPVLRNLEQLLFEMEYQKINTENFTEGLSECLNLLLRRVGDHRFFTRVIPVIMNSVAILYFKCVLGDEEFQEKLQEINSTYKPLVSELKFPGNNDQRITELLNSLKAMFDTLVTGVKKISCLQMGNWNQALEVEENRDSLKKNIVDKMSYLEQYCCVLGTINQYFQTITLSNTTITLLLKELIQRLFQNSLKKKKNITIYPILLIATKGLCQVLKDHRFPEGSREIFDILDIYLDTSKLEIATRNSLLSEMDGLLCHRDKALVTKVIYLFRRNNKESWDIRERVKAHIAITLGSMAMSIIHATHQASTSLQPEWCSFDAKVCESRFVTLHTLIPTLDCLARGSNEDYKQRADKEQTLLKINTLETLRHLQKRGLHPNIIQVIAYQNTPLPLFYIVDRYVDQSLNSFIMKLRIERNWMSSTEMVTLIIDILAAIIYLHENNVVHRDITTYSFSVIEKEQTRKVVLTDFRIARIMQGTSSAMSTRISDSSIDQIPVRWSAHESIIEDIYSPRSDTYMVGHVIQEIFTHGCCPYTELYNMETETVLTLIIFHELPPRQWPCIPKPIHDIVLKCVQPEAENRISLGSIPILLNQFMVQLTHSGEDNRLPRPFEDDKLYPVVDEKLCDKPERGIPISIRQLKQTNERPRQSYFNLRKSKRKQSLKTELTEADLLSDDQPYINMGIYTSRIREPVPDRFVDVFTNLIHCSNTHDILQLEQPIEMRNKGLDGSLLYYKCKNGISVMDIASTRYFGDPEYQESNYLLIIYKMAEFVCKLHENNFIHRDIQCRHLYYQLENKQIFSLRLGRMLYLSNMSIDDSILGEVFDDNKNWMPLEVLQGEHNSNEASQGGQYSNESDIYMLAMTFYEYFSILELRKQNPVARHIECVPYCKIKRNQLLEHIYSGELPLKPKYCPDWLYDDIMKKCWNRDRTQRPTAHEVVKQIRENLQFGTTTKLDDEDIEVNQLQHSPESSSTEYPQSESDSFTGTGNLDINAGQIQQPLRYPPTANILRRKDNGTNHVSRTEMGRSFSMNPVYESSDSTNICPPIRFVNNFGTSSNYFISSSSDENDILGTDISFKAPSRKTDIVHSYSRDPSIDPQQNGFGFYRPKSTINIDATPSGTSEQGEYNTDRGDIKDSKRHLSDENFYQPLYKSVPEIDNGSANYCSRMLNNKPAIIKKPTSSFADDNHVDKKKSKCVSFKIPSETLASQFSLGKQDQEERLLPDEKEAITSTSTTDTSEVLCTASEIEGHTREKDASSTIYEKVAAPNKTRANRCLELIKCANSSTETSSDSAHSDSSTQISNLLSETDQLLLSYDSRNRKIRSDDNRAGPNSSSEYRASVFSARPCSIDCANSDSSSCESVDDNGMLIKENVRFKNALNSRLEACSNATSLIQCINSNSSSYSDSDVPNEMTQTFSKYRSDVEQIVPQKKSSDTQSITNLEEYEDAISKDNDYLTF